MLSFEGCSTVCGYRWQPRGTTSHVRRPDGAWVERPAITGVYFCTCNYEEFISPGCPRSIPRRDADREVWRQVCNAINHPDILLDQAHILVDEIKRESTISSVDRERIEKELDSLFQKRQWTITQARKGGITEDEMERRLNEYSQLEVQLKSELISMEKAIDEQLLIDWEAKVTHYLDDLKTGIQALNSEPAIEEEWLESFELKRQIVQFLVERVTIDVHRQLTVTIHLNLLEILEESRKKDSNSGSSSQWPVSVHPAKSNTHPKRSLFGGRYGHVRVSAIWNG